MPLQCREFISAALDRLGPESDITAMRRLMLLRHAKTERAAPGERDRDRKLMKRGRADAPAIGAYMAHHGLVPDLALVSPAKRAQETWALVAPAFAKAPRTVTDERIYNASPEALIGAIGETRKAHTLVVVGHNPGLHDLALQLIASGDVDMREAAQREAAHFGPRCHRSAGRRLVALASPCRPAGALCQSAADRRRDGMRCTKQT